LILFWRGFAVTKNTSISASVRLAVRAAEMPGGKAPEGIFRREHQDCINPALVFLEIA